MLAAFVLRAACVMSLVVSKSVTTVPIQIVHGIILVPATVDGHRGEFILDTGSPETILNGAYLRQNAGSGFDTVTTNDTTSAMPGIVSSLALQIGDRTFPVGPAQAGIPIVAMMTSLTTHERYFGHALLGILGLNVFQHDELVIDYVHHQLMLIPLDSAGSRQVAVPEYAPTQRVPMLARNGGGPHWYLPATLGESADTLLVDLGNDLSELTPATQARLAAHVHATGQTIDVIEEQHKPQLLVDHLAFAGTSYDSVTFYGSHVREDCLGNLFFSRLGVIGFNFPASQLMLYH